MLGRKTARRRRCLRVDVRSSRSNGAVIAAPQPSARSLTQRSNLSSFRKTVNCRTALWRNRRGLPRWPWILYWGARRGCCQMGFRYRKSIILSPMRANVSRSRYLQLLVRATRFHLEFWAKWGSRNSWDSWPGLSYSSKRTAGSALLLSLIVAGLSGLFILAARGNRLAQVCLGALVVLGFILTVSTHSSGPVTSMSIGEKTDIEKVSGQSSITNQSNETIVGRSVGEEVQSPNEIVPGNVKPIEKPVALGEPTDLSAIHARRITLNRTPSTLT